MKVFFENLIIFLLVTIIMFYIFTTYVFVRWCSEYEFDIFCSNGYCGHINHEKVDNLNSFKLRGLGAGIKNMSELWDNDSRDIYDTYGIAYWVQTQLVVWQITQYNILSVLIGIATVVGYNIILSKKFNKAIKFLLGYIIPIVFLPTLYYFVRLKCDKVFVETNKLIEFGIVYTIIFLLMYIMINKNSIKNNG